MDYNYTLLIRDYCGRYINSSPAVITVVNELIEDKTVVLNVSMFNDTWWSIAVQVSYCNYIMETGYTNLTNIGKTIISLSLY